jgi:phospholipid/cholesterol/gamma-HCH transport system substrate-binding protein
MIKQAPSLGRIAAMVVFTLSCFGILLFLWLSFGGAIPLRPQGYRFHAHIPEAATLAQEADVRLAGVNVGKVKTKKLDKGAARTDVEIELDQAYAPIPKDTRVILRQKTLLGESYLELAQGHKSAGNLPDGGTLPDVQVEPTVQLDEIFSAFDKPTRTAFQVWVTELAKAIRGRGAQDLNSAIGNLEGFATGGAKLFKVLDEQEFAVRRLVRNTGEVFGAINRRQGALHDLIINANNTFSATASQQEALAQTFQIFPTFLDESKATLARLETFSRNAHPLINDLKRPAKDLGPTVKDLGDLAPDLTRLFKALPALVKAGKKGLPDLTRVLAGAEPVFSGLHTFLTQLGPILSYANYHQATLSSFLTIGGTNFGCTIRGLGSCNPDAGSKRYQVNFTVIEAASLMQHPTRPPEERGNAYLAPNAYLRAAATGVLESFDCSNDGGPQQNPNDFQPDPLTDPPPKPPCFVAPGSLYNGKIFPIPQAGKTTKVNPPHNQEGTSIANDPFPTDPIR